MPTPITKATRDYQNNACLNKYGNDTWVYIQSFKRLAQLGAQHIVTEHDDTDILVISVMQNYRHYLELSLAELSHMAARATQANYQVFEGHPLKNHWGIAKKLLTSYLKQQNQSRSCLTPIEEIIDEIHALDPDGFAFRYPTTKIKQGAIPNLLGVTYIQVGEVKRRMDEVGNIMDALSHGLIETCEWNDAALADFADDAAQEYDAEMRAEYEAEMRELYADFV